MSNKIKKYFRSDSLLETIEEAVDIVQSTLGPLGKNVVIKRDINSKPVITKDGVTVLKDIKYKEAQKNAAIELVREAAQKTAEIAGDGTTTATILANIMLQKSRKIGSISNEIKIKSGIEKGIKDSRNIIKSIKKDLNEKGIKSIASISANDKSVGNIISNVISEVGTDAVITVEEGNTSSTEYEVVDGMRIDNRGFLSPYFINNDQKYVSELSNCYILLYDGNLSNLDSISPILEQINQKQNASFLVIANNVEGQALALLVINSARGMIKASAIKSPSFGSDRIEQMEDIATLTGGTVISSNKGIDIEDVTMDHLGYSNKVIVGKDYTDIIDGNGDVNEIEKRVKSINTKIDQEPSGYEKEKMHERIAKLISGVAIIRAGGESELEMKEIRDRIEDAVYATKSAISEGIIPGGGFSLVYAHYKMKENLNISNFISEDEFFGYKVVMESLIEPFKILCVNSGIDNSEKLINEMLDKNKVYNFVTNEFENKYSGNVVDPFKVIDTVLLKVGSIVSSIITTEKMVIVDENENNDEEKSNSGMMY